MRVCRGDCPHLHLLRQPQRTGRSVSNLHPGASKPQPHVSGTCGGAGWEVGPRTQGTQCVPQACPRQAQRPGPQARSCLPAQEQPGPGGQEDPPFLPPCDLRSAPMTTETGLTQFQAPETPGNPAKALPWWGPCFCGGGGTVDRMNPSHSIEVLGCRERKRRAGLEVRRAGWSERVPTVTV